MQQIQFTDKLTADLVKTNASDLDVARAAWVSTVGGDAREKESGRVEGLIKFLWENRHTSPFEHGSFTFFIKCPIFVAREFMRHRTFSFNEESGRYKVLDPVFYLPSPERNLVQVGKPGAYEFSPGSDTQYSAVKHSISYTARTAYGLYEHQLSYGVAKEVARMVLPVSIYTSFYATANPLNLMKFLSLRTAGDAQFEIQQVALQMEDHFANTMPMTHRFWRDDGE